MELMKYKVFALVIRSEFLGSHLFLEFHVCTLSQLMKLEKSHTFPLQVISFCKFVVVFYLTTNSFHVSIDRFVSCLAFICTPDYPQGFLVSGGGDSTVSVHTLTTFQSFLIHIYQCVK